MAVIFELLRSEITVKRGVFIAQAFVEALCVVSWIEHTLTHSNELVRNVEFRLKPVSHKRKCLVDMS